MTIDYLIFKFINDLAGRSSILDYFGIFCAKYLIWIFVILIVILFIFSSNKKEKHLIRRTFICLLGSLIIALAINYFIFLFYFRARPFVDHQIIQLINLSALSKSFPSDHTSIAFAIAASVYFWYKKVGIILLILALLVGLSRIFVGVHYPLDVIAGAATGLISTLVSYKLIKFLKL